MATHPLRALTLYPQSGPAKDYVRVEDGGRVAWCPASTTFGRGAPHEPLPDAPRLSPAELAQLIAAALE
ncbi:MAG TPA: hypothetical protein VGN08_07085 [Solirubrobacteraceae bacterium]|jgi:hypothetical protein